MTVYPRLRYSFCAGRFVALTSSRTIRASRRRKPLFNPFQQVTCQPAAAMFGRDADRRDVTSVIRLKQSDHETRHRAVLRYDPIRNRFGRGEQVLKSVAAVGFAIDETALIELPAFVDLSNRQRTQVVVHVGRRHQRQGRRVALRLVAGRSATTLVEISLILP